MNMLYIVVLPFNNQLLGVFKDKKLAEKYSHNIPNSTVQYIYTDLEVRYWL